MACQALAAHAVGMADGDGAAVDVEAVAGNAQLVAAINHLHGKGLVQLPQVDVVHGQAQARQHLGDGEHRANAHLVGLTTGHGKAQEAAQRCQAFLLRQRFAHHHAGAGAVGELARVAGRNQAAGHGGAQVLDAVIGGAGPNAFVLAAGHLLGHQAHELVGHAHGDSDRRDLGREQARFLCRRSALLTGGAVFVHLNARDAIALGHLLGRLQHVPVDLRLVRGEPGIFQHVRVHLLLHAGDAFHAAGDKHVGLAGDDALRGQRNGLQTGGTKAVQGHARHRHRATGHERDLARDVGARGALGAGATHDHVLDLGGVNAGARNRVLHGVATERGSMRQVECALPALGQRGARGGNDYGGCHGYSPCRFQLSGAFAPSLSRRW